LQGILGGRVGGIMGILLWDMEIVVGFVPMQLYLFFIFKMIKL
jgi:hypothetical protein